jgi:mannan endo-1,4-beta-mannosidase
LRRVHQFTGILIIFVIVSACKTIEPPPPWSWPAVPGFMTASGTGFKDGFKFMGANLDPWRFNTAIGEIYSQAEIENWVYNAVWYTHARVIRMHMNGGAFEPTVGNYGESAFIQLDYLLAAASNNNVYVLISLRDYCWSPWPPDNRCYDSYWYMDGGTQANPKKDNILTLSDSMTAFKNFISHVVNRVNTVTGVAYKNDPNIFGWELINEPNMVSGIDVWFSNVGGYVKSIDPNHLVGMATGDLSSSGWDPSSGDWNKINVPELDFIDLHYYADLYNPGNTNWGARLTQVLGKAVTLNKPLIMGEFGYPNNYPESKIENLYGAVNSISLNAGVAGVMPYSWGPPGPNHFGDPGSFCMYTDDAGICAQLRSLAP